MRKSRRDLPLLSLRKMQEITKKNLNREKLWNFRAWENGGNGDKEMSLPLFLYLKKEEQDNTEVLLILICY